MASEEPIYLCNNCDFSACNRQELAQHLTKTHNQTLYQCDLCLFVSCHKSSLDEHKSQDHKYICCEVCGEPCKNEKDLLLHTRKLHADLLSYQQDTQRRPKFSDTPPLLLPSIDKTFNLTEQANALYLSQFNNHNIQHETELNTPLAIPSATCADTVMELMPQKFKRQYQCNGCEYRTFSPRDYLYHRRETHFDNSAIYECHMCVYATKHYQKLARHSLLVHKVPMSAPIKPRKRKPKSVYVDVPPQEQDMPVSHLMHDEDSDLETAPTSRPPLCKEDRSPIKSPKTKFACSKCDFQSKSKFLLSQHEKTVHLRNKFFRCLKCGFVTNERGRYNKHVKYHNLPILVCSECEFSTPYRWNLERHMKNHQQTTAKYKCKKCSFMVNSSKSMKTHVLYHHKNTTTPEDMGGEEDAKNGNIDEDDTEVSNNEADQDGSTGWKSDDEDDKEEDEQFIIPTKYKKNPGLTSEHAPVEESPPKYPCPLCGVVFNKLAWLARHLSQKHNQETPKASKMAKSFRKVEANKPSTSELTDEDAGFEEFCQETKRPKFKASINAVKKASPVVRKPGTNITKHTGTNKAANKLLKNVKRKAVSGPSKSSFPTHMCQVCLYKNTLMSEMEKHVLTHCPDKPFLCHLCKFCCRWKGDMKRHIVRNHGQAAVTVFERSENPLMKYIKTLPSEVQISEKSDDLNEELDEYEDEECETPRSFKKPKTKAELSARLKNEPMLLLSTKFRNIAPPSRSKNEGYFLSTKQNACVSKKQSQEECPLDLTTAKEDSKNLSNLENLLRMEPVKLPRIQMNSPVLVLEHKDDDLTEAKGIKRSTDSDDSYDEGNLFQRYLEAQQNYFYGEKDDIPIATAPQKKKIKLLDDSTDKTFHSKKYKCTYCPFMSNTASRFHVHIVQHLNKKPFMCSVCAYRSNWEWDITKHIKIKSSRDPQHFAAQMVIADETGLKNYEKYNKFLVSDNTNLTLGSTPQTGASCSQDDTLEQVLSPEDVVETVLVTSEQDANRDANLNAAAQAHSADVYRCGHCLFKHPDKKIVISHLAIHFRSKPYQCKLCGITSSWKHVMLRHVKSQHDGEPEDIEDRLHFVTRGTTLYVSNTAVDKHEETLSTSVFECQLCPYTSEYNHHMQVHLRQHCQREGATIKCPHCPFWVRYRKTLTSHLRFHPEANSTGSSVSSLTSQSGIMDESEETEINDKSKQDKDISAQLDAPVSSPPRKYKCESCFFKSDNKSHYLYHKQFHRPNKNAPFKCMYCSYWSCFKNVINKHERTHIELSGEPDTELLNPQSEMVEVSGKLIKMFKCRFCPMMNKRRSSVKAHESQHSSEKCMKFSCSTCSYQSNNQGVMTSHMRLHSDSNVTIADILNESLKHPLEPLSVPTGSSNEGPARKLHVPNKRNKPVTYICKHCPAIFKTKHDLANHCSFHGAKLPFSCTHCDYKARHKPHLHRHMTVHTPEYMVKREQTIRDTIQQDNNDSTLSKLLTEPAGFACNSNVIDDPDGLLKEKENLVAYSKNISTGKNSKRKFKCKNCPMAYIVPEELEFHVKLHKSGAEHPCLKCSYAVNDADLLALHSKIHSKSLSQSPFLQDISASLSLDSLVHKSGPKVMSCPLCPAVFSKPGRIEKHLSLHGAKNKYTCDECDYSVRLGANLGKHKKVHQSDYNPVCLRKATKKEKKQSVVKEPPSTSEPTPPETVSTPSPAKKGLTRSYNREPKEKHIFQCSHCPYCSARKDSVISHMNRHGSASRVVACPYCDYGTSTASFMKDHIKLHFQPRSFIKVKAYMKYDQLEIWSCNGSKAMIFKDQGEGKKSRFCSEVIEEEPEDLWDEHESVDEINTTSVKEETKDSSDVMSDSDQDSSSKCERNLIEDAIQEGKKLEIVLTDVLTNKKINEKCNINLLPVKKEDLSNDETTSTPVGTDCSNVSPVEENESMPKEEDNNTEDIIMEDVTESSSLTLSSLGNESAIEDNTAEEWPLKRVDTPTDVLNYIMDKLDEGHTTYDEHVDISSVDVEMESVDGSVPEDTELPIQDDETSPIGEELAITANLEQSDCNNSDNGVDVVEKIAIENDITNAHSPIDTGTLATA